MPIRHAVFACGVIGVAMSPGSGPDLATVHELQIDHTAPNLVRFVSHTQLDEFQGVTDKIDGYVVLAGSGLSGAAEGLGTDLYFEVDLASLDTGIGLRNRHMRDNYLDVEKYPYALFKGTIARIDEMGGDGAARVAAAGTFTVHGVPREREITCDVTPAGSAYRATCAFQVLLSDHSITIPKIMFLKLANEIQVDVAFTVSPVGEGAGGKP